MRTTTRYASLAALLTVAVFALLGVFNIFQFGICRMIPSTCGTEADRLICGWRGYGQDRVWRPGVGWEPVYDVSSEDKQRMLREMGLDVEEDVAPVDDESASVQPEL